MKKYLCLFTSLLLSFVIIFISGCSKDEGGPGSDSGKIKTDNSVFVIKKSIPSTGGQLDVSGTQTPIEGLSLVVPNGAYAETKDFSVSYSNITSHTLGQYFNPISPLIEITNGDAYADKLLKLRIPLTANPGYYRMAFYYDRKSGTLEGIPIVSNNNNYMEVALRHFSLIVVTEVQKDLLIQGGGFQSFFDPTVNGWSFVNYGTYPESQGICAGMSIGAAYYFKNFSATVNLFSYFENDNLWFRTSDLWEDDARGLRFATSIHSIEEQFWSSNNKSITQILNAPEEDRFWNLIYNMLMSKQPQLIYVNNTATDTAHMIIGYAYNINATGAFFSIYDPNSPGLTKLLEFNLNTKTFKPYVSAANATALAQGYFTSYDKIAFVPLSSVISDADMNLLWQKVQNKTIGEGIFPSYKIYAVPKDPSFTKVELKIDDHTFSNYIPFDEFDFNVTGLDPNYNLKLEALSFLPGFGIERINPAQTIKMAQKDTLIGLYLKAIPPNEKSEKWIGFEWFKIQLRNIWIEPSDTTVTINTEIKFKARHNGSAPKHARFAWNYGDNKQETSTDSVITHKYSAVGEYTVTLTVTDLDNQKEVAKVISTVNVTVWPKIAITLRGMSGTTPPSTIKASDGSDIAFILWDNRSVTNAPSLKWTKNQFDVDFQYSLFPAIYTCHINGTLSDDGKNIIVLNAILSAIAPDDEFTYQTAIVLQNFPVDVYVPGQIVGKTLSGAAAHTKVAQLSWKQIHKDEKGNPVEINLQSVDWSSNQTQLSVFFYDR